MENPLQEKIYIRFDIFIVLINTVYTIAEEVFIVKVSNKQVWGK